MDEETVIDGPLFQTWEETMLKKSSFAVSVSAGVLLALSVANNAFAQKKYIIDHVPTSTSEFLQQHVIDVDDRPGHQVRVYLLHNDYPNKDLSFAGIIVKESLVHGISDYINFSGPFTTYGVYTLEDGSKVFSRSNGTSQKSKADGGGEVLKFSYVENFVGGTGQFKAIRGQIT